jgi:enamine deaminase RidA (YjgF/YER057c/UK114 family)
MIMESPGWRRSAAADRMNFTMDSVSYLHLAQLHSNPAFTQAVRIPAGHDLIVIGGQNGLDSSGSVVSDDIGDQARHALSNVQACLREAHADLGHAVGWSVLIKGGAPLYDGFVAFMEVWGQGPTRRRSPSRWSAALAVPGALCEIEVLAAVPSA